VRRLRARAEVENGSIVITELPHGVQEGGEDGILREIVDLIVDRSLPDVVDLNDLSDRRGLRVLIGLPDGAVPELVLGRLWKPTQLEVTIPIDLGRPLQQLLATYNGVAPDELERIATEYGDARRTSSAF
jgi:DNA gyrase/topoisomerase IV subunit A